MAGVLIPNLQLSTASDAVLNEAPSKYLHSVAVGVDEGLAEALENSKGMVDADGLARKVDTAEAVAFEMAVTAAVAAVAATTVIVGLWMMGEFCVLCGQ